MKVLIFGAYGQLGSDLRKTIPANIELIAPKRAEVDVTYYGSLKEFFSNVKPDTIINCSAYVKVDQAEDEPEEALKTNAVALKYIIQSLRNNPKIIHISTDYVFDGKKRGEPYCEDDIPDPINIYGLSKYAGETILRNYYEKHYIIRSSSLYGVSGASGKGGNFVYTILKKAKAGEKIRVVDDIFMVPTHTLQLADAIWKLALYDYPFGIYHITHTGYCSWYEFTKTILGVTGINVHIEPIKSHEFPMKAKRPLWSVLGTKKGMELCHWREGLMEFIRITKEEGRI